MPCLAVVGGVRIEFYVDEHPPPHFHARMAEFVAAIGIDPVVILAGSLPRAKAGTVLEWAEDHQVELLRAWNTIREGRKPRKIA